MKQPIKMKTNIIKFTLSFLSAMFIFSGNIANALTEQQQKGFKSIDIVNSTNYIFEIAFQDASSAGYVTIPHNTSTTPKKVAAATGKSIAAQNSEVKIKLTGGEEKILTIDWEKDRVSQQYSLKPNASQPLEVNLLIKFATFAHDQARMSIALDPSKPIKKLDPTKP